ncbi:MAG TPA: four helix bundle protein [Myxococcales bacterium]
MAQDSVLPHETLVAYQVACELLVAIRDADIDDSGLREQALRSAKSACLNIAEASGRESSADQKRVYAIARGEASEATAAIQIAALAGDCRRESGEKATASGRRLYGLLTGLIRRPP